MSVVVFASYLNCPTHLALVQEAIEHEVLINDEELSYGRNFARVWDRGEPFVSLEHDVIPWPGAIAALLECPQPRCHHRFPAAPPGNLPLGFGVGKYRPKGKAPEAWRTTSWWRLDGQVVPVLNERLGWEHVHEPPFAHVRAL